MPCTVVGRVFLFDFLIATLAVIFLAGTVRTGAGWQGMKSFTGQFW